MEHFIQGLPLFYRAEGPQNTRGLRQSVPLEEISLKIGNELAHFHGQVRHSTSIHTALPDPTDLGNKIFKLTATWSGILLRENRAKIKIYKKLY